MAASTSSKIRQYSGPILFERGFRPFFLGAGIFAALIMPLWVLVLSGHLDVPGYMAAREWHVHEMLFGYLSAVLCGFLLTAIPNWTGRLPVIGMPLFLLWSLWLAGRLVMFLNIGTSIPVIVIETSFLFALSIVILREVVSGKNYRNLPICILVTLFALANLAYHYLVMREDDTALIERGALSIILILLVLVGGRITPSFTRNWMKKRELHPLPASFGFVDQFAMGMAIISAILWTFSGFEMLNAFCLLVFSGAMFVRIFRWQGVKVLSEPLLVVLHLGQLWIPVWALLTVMSYLFPESLSFSQSTHALTTGAIATMTLAVMMRAGLGHTGREITGGTGTILLFVKITLSAILRICGELLPLDYDTIIALSGLCWSTAFVLFIIIMAPVLTTRRQ